MIGKTTFEKKSNKKMTRVREITSIGGQQNPEGLFIPSVKLQHGDNAAFVIGWW